MKKKENSSNNLLFNEKKNVKKGKNQESPLKSKRDNALNKNYTTENKPDEQLFENNESIFVKKKNNNKSKSPIAMQINEEEKIYF